MTLGLDRERKLQITCLRGDGNDRKESWQQGSFPRVISSSPHQLYSGHFVISSLSITLPSPHSLLWPCQAPQEGVYLPTNPYTQGPWLRMPAHLPTSWCLLAYYLGACYFPPGMVQSATPTTITITQRSLCELGRREYRDRWGYGGTLQQK